ncbi:MAG: 5'/3'-nucleotidase SurE [Geobacteraceae bacterium]|nr:5'/3'-nucleotidase SurE [Geobacteraceae bacterium]
MKILVTNDDGIDAPGINALAEALCEVAEVAVVAPDRERSAVSHALTLHHPLRAIKVGQNRYSVDGTPTDCVNLGIHSLLDFHPDIVVSGINRGANLGDDVTYSGTVAAALEATLMGIPAIAFSLATLADDANYSQAASFAVRLAALVIKNGLPKDTFLNVNFPAKGELLSPLITTQGKRRYEGTIVDKVDPRGRSYYWIGTADLDFHDIEGSDYAAIKRGHISITPLHLDMTNHYSIAHLNSWTF